MLVLGCILISLIFAPLGCVMLWQRYSYVSDGIIHASMLAVVLHLLFSVPLFLTLLLVSKAFALLVNWLTDETKDPSALVNLVSNTMVAGALLLCTVYGRSEDLHDLLIGDINLINHQTLAYLAGILILLCGYFFNKLPKIVIISFSSDIAAVQGLKPQRLNRNILLITTLVIATTIKLVGGLLISSLLIIPAMIAKALSNNPTQMVVYSLFTALALNGLGLISWYWLDLPINSMIVLYGALALFVIQFYDKRRIN